jgi:uncharacterized RDD family membrane protein YckC
MENTPKPDTPADVTQSTPIVVTPSGVAQPAVLMTPAPPSTPVTLPTPTPVMVKPVPPTNATPPPPPVATPAAANDSVGPTGQRPWKPIVLDDIEPPSFEHGHGHPFMLLIRRTLAFLLDTAGIGFFFALFGYDAMKNGRLPIPMDERGFVELFAIALGAAVLLLFLFEAITGTSIGKLLFGLHVRRTSGERAGFKQIFWRNLFRIVEFVIIPVAVIMILVLKHRQRIGDKVSDTTVGRSPIGPFAPVTALLIIGALSWLVVTYGGGEDTLKTLRAQAEPYATDLYNRAAGVVSSKLHAQSATNGAQPVSQPQETQPSAPPSAAPTPA